MVLVGLLAPIGTVVMLAYFLSAPKRQRKFIKALCDTLNAKYGAQRGVKFELGQTVVVTRKGTKVFPPAIIVTVDKPGVVIPNIDVFAPSQESLDIIRAYKEVNSDSTVTVNVIPPDNDEAPAYSSLL